MNKTLFLILTFFLLSITYAQTSIPENIKSNPNYYDYSADFSETIEVKVWSSENNSGVFKLNKGTELIQLLTYAGGVSEKVEYDEIRIVRAGGNNEVIKINYDDMFESDKIKSINNPVLMNGDIVITTSKTTWMQDILPFTTVLSILTSITTLIYIIVRYNK